MERRAPNGGYQFEAKNLYRRVVWSELIKGKPKPAQKKVLMMPSREGIEIGVAESFGILRENIYPVDENPAIIAHLTRDFPGMARIPGAHGVPLHIACGRIRDAGVRIHAANFDLTSQASFPLLCTLADSSEAHVFASHSRVAVTMLRGREGGKINRLLDRVAESHGDILEWMRSKHFGPVDMKPWDIARILFAGMCFDPGRCNLGLARSGAYRSGKQTMLWAVFEQGSPNRSQKKIQARIRFLDLMSGYYHEMFEMFLAEAEAREAEIERGED